MLPVPTCYIKESSWWRR